MKMPKVLSHGGVVVPMVTPFTSRGELDEAAVRRIIDRLAGCQLGIFILGVCFFAGDHGLFVQNFINEFLLAEFFGTGYFQLLCDIEQFGNEHVV